MDQPMIHIKQNQECELIQVKKTVEWLVLNTIVSVFNPVDFKGYQRQINQKHCEKIVKYLERDFFLPTSIICASKGPYEESSQLTVVDGQHRIEAFKMMKDKNEDRFNEIKDYELSVVILEAATEIIEINTFITINKTSRKVDTSLAYVLKNKLNANSSSTSEGLDMSRRDYLAVELAQRVNDSLYPLSTWRGMISFEGSPKNSQKLISLNSFVKSTRSLLYALEKKGVLDLHWNSEPEVIECLDNIELVFTEIWKSVNRRWETLSNGDLDERRILQGAIGYTAINRLLSRKLNELSGMVDMRAFIENCNRWINAISVSEEVWRNGGEFSNFSSETGYSVVTNVLYESMGGHL